MRMSTERQSFDFNSVIPQTYQNKAEAFARCLHDKLFTLSGFAEGVTEAIGNRSRMEWNLGATAYPGEIAGEEPFCGERLMRFSSCSMQSNCIGEREEDYEVPYRVLRESSSTGNLEKHSESSPFAKRDPLMERLNESVVKLEVSHGKLELETDPKLRRCSSLKTWKTPPGTPSEKKIVRFADALGLDLADVRTFLDEIPKIPISAFEDLHCDYGNTYPIHPTNPTLIPRFPQPMCQLDFMERIKHESVCLESATLTDSAVLTVSGCIRVRNVAYEKSVLVRCTTDSWKKFVDVRASYVPNSSDGFSDRFSFVLYGHTLRIGQKLEFAVRMEASGQQYWDNNRGRNYVFECLPQSPSTSQFTEVPLRPTETWSGFY